MTTGVAADVKTTGVTPVDIGICPPVICLICVWPTFIVVMFAPLLMAVRDGAVART